MPNGRSAKRTSRIIQQRASQFIQIQKGPKWKRELVPDHKFDYLDVEEFRKASFYNCIRSRKRNDMWAFYVFYTLKGWKRLLFAQGPRQIIAGITVYALLKSAWTAKDGSFHLDTDWDVYGTDWPQRVALISMSFTCLLWCLSIIDLGVACVLYVPVFIRIQGNLKEYCCHKIDKRITEILEKQRQKRLRAQEKNNSKKKPSKKEQEAEKLAAAMDPVQEEHMSYNLDDDHSNLLHGSSNSASNKIAIGTPRTPYSETPRTPYSEPAYPTSPYNPPPPRRAYTDRSYDYYNSPVPPMPQVNHNYHPPSYEQSDASYFELQSPYQHHQQASPFPSTPSMNYQEHIYDSHVPQTPHHQPSPLPGHRAAGPVHGSYGSNSPYSDYF
ncbi:hypothetical protein BCR43DRAFT_509863 [Syncephalastrum racemosum]|uniref:Uncharacterized protein n=1 Tax=Syncephalastrum racemosum TaxID=13706 RepID=A0A1X2HUF2_SYNRA|nr:hypothetical protein BCR43DRAFT_509863 [Syncephalastrum racemosum]